MELPTRSLVLRVCQFRHDRINVDYYISTDNFCQLILLRVFKIFYFFSYFTYFSLFLPYYPLKGDFLIMKATGIVRRIDELGRVVIPKEIRRTLRIKEGDPLEIFTDRDELMLKKYSPIASLERFSKATARSLNDLSGKLAVICDTDGILHAYGDGKKELDGKNLSQDMERILRERRSYIANAIDGGDVIPLTSSPEEPFTAQVIVPIVSGGDCLGAVAVLSKENGAKMDGVDMNLARLTADILANQFE